MTRQKIIDLGDRMKEQDIRADQQDQTVKELSAKVGAVERDQAQIAGEIRSFAQAQQSGHSLLANQIQALDRLVEAKLDGLIAEIRARSGRRAPPRKTNA